MSDREDEFDDEFLPDEHELRKKIKKLTKELKEEEITNRKKQRNDEVIYNARLENQKLWYEDQISTLRDQIQTMIEKNWELNDACKVFAKGIENLKKEGVIMTATETWNRKGVNGSLEVRIAQLASIGRTNISVIPHRVDHHGYTVEAIIVSQYIEKYKKSV